MRADRLLQIVQLLRRHDRLSAAELARRLDVTRRTILRDMIALSGAGIPVYAEHGRGGGYALLGGYEPDVEQLTRAEARALFVAEGAGTARALGLGASFGSALRKLATALPDDEHHLVAHVRDRILIDTGGWLQDAPNDDALPDVQAAVLDDRRIRIRYQSKQAPRPGNRTVDPWGLLQVGTTWYLVAAHRGRPRSYRISRISAVTRLGEPSRRPPGLDLRQVWREMRDDFRSAASVEILLRVRPRRRSMVTYALSTVALGRPEPVPGEPDTFRLAVRSLRGAAAMLVSFGSDIDVIGPPELREGIIQIADQSLEHHRRSSARTD